MSRCCVCLQEFSGEDAPILMMDATGHPLVLCPSCEGLLDAIAGKPDSPERDRAIEALSELDVADPMVATELSRIISGEDTPLTEEDGWEDEEAVLKEAPPTATPIAGKASSLYFYLGVGCLAVAMLLFIILKIVR